ncbi:MAG: NAAT family transporter [Bacteroidetes bacterium]|nr:NAAT family transporter [Bacteroidota bacterium]
MAEITTYIKTFIAVFVLVNPLEGIPLFLSETQNVPKEKRTAIAKKTSIAVTVILLLSLFSGKYILELFGIDLPAFQLAGGIIIFLIALNMVLSSDDSSKDTGDTQPAKDPDRIAIVPLAIPLLAGPGAISTVILYGSMGTGITHYIVLSGIILAVGLAAWLSLKAAVPMTTFLHQTGVRVLTKISGLLVAAIAVEMALNGLIKLLPKLHAN